tara:strand:+ start:3488 stop:4321 length:834 start_codon:yes stop_codon:yes gene_type:complete
MQTTVLILISISLIALYISFNDTETLTMGGESHNDRDSFLNEYVKKRFEAKEKEVNELDGKKLLENDGKLEVVNERPLKDVLRVKTDNNNIYGIKKHKAITEENTKSNALNYNFLSGMYLNSNPFDGGTEVAVGPEIETDVVPAYKYGIKKKNLEFNMFKDRGLSDGTISHEDVKSFDGKQTFKYMTLAKEQLRNAQENSYKNNIDVFDGQNDIIAYNYNTKINPNNTPDMLNYRDSIELNNNDITRRKESINDPKIEESVLSLKSMVNRRVLKDFS